MIVVIGVTGLTGRMGRAITQVCEGHPKTCLIGGVTRSQMIVPEQSDSSLIITDNPQDIFPKCDVVVDFSHASVTPVFARLAAEMGKPFFTGTTGLDPETIDLLQDISKKIPVLYASNTSLSLIVTTHMTKLAAKLLQDYEYDISIIDKHHQWKKDAPSGTAITLGKGILAANKSKKTPTYASIRSGSIIGEHEIMFSGEGETITLHHSVTDRRVFARGAVTGALWLAKQGPGFYSMDDVLLGPNESL